MRKLKVASFSILFPNDDYYGRDAVCTVQQQAGLKKPVRGGKLREAGSLQQQLIQTA